MFLVMDLWCFQGCIFRSLIGGSGALLAVHVFPFYSGEVYRYNLPEISDSHYMVKSCQMAIICLIHS